MLQFTRTRVLFWTIYKPETPFQLFPKCRSVVRNGSNPQNTRFAVSKGNWMVAREIQVEVKIVDRDTDWFTYDHQSVADTRDIHFLPVEPTHIRRLGEDMAVHRL